MNECFATWLTKGVFSGMEYSPPTLSSYRHARLVEGNKKRLCRVMFCLRYVNFISFRSLSHELLLIRYSVNNKRIKNERNMQFIIFFECYMYVVINGIFSSRFIVQREQKHAYRLWRSSCVKCEKIGNFIKSAGRH